MEIEKKNFYKLTLAQKRIYNDNKIFSGIPVNNKAFFIKYDHILDKTLLEQAINKVIQKNEGLRLRYVIPDSGIEPVQYISSFKWLSLDSIDFSESEEDRIQRMDNWKNKITQEPFKILDNNLFYFIFVKFNKIESGYYLKIHQAISDDWSDNFIFSEINRIYEALKEGKKIDGSTYPSFIDFVSEEQKYLDSVQMEIDKDFWFNTMDPLPESINFIPKKGDATNIKGDISVIFFPDDLFGVICKYCITHRISITNLILSIISIYAARVSGCNDIPIGMNNHLRVQKEIRNVFGVFSNIIPVRLNVDETMTFETYVKITGQVIQYLLQSHQKYPFSKLASDLKETMGEDINELIEIYLSLKDTQISETYYYEKVFQGYSRYPFEIQIIQAENQLGIEYNFQIECFSHSDINRIHQGLVNILIDALKKPRKKISEINIISSDERKQILYNFNNTTTEFRDKLTIHQMFEIQAQKTPENIALYGPSLCHSTLNKNKEIGSLSFQYEEQELSYSQLNEKANQLARIFRKKGISTNSIVVIVIERSIEMIIGMLGILKAGGAYLPIDSQYPEARKKYIINDCCATTLFTQHNLPAINRDAFETIPKSSIILADEIDIYQGDTKNIECINSPHDPAYIIYTSGTTGKPKGVMLKHIGISSLNTEFNENIKISENDRVIQFASNSFDASVWEIYMALLNGAGLYLIGKDIIDNYIVFQEYLNIRKITVATLPPLYVNNLDPNKIDTLRVLVTAGSSPGSDLVKKWRNKLRYINAYGPTESTICASYWIADEGLDSSEIISIGSPINNTQLYILNKHFQLNPVGIPGELCIASIGLAVGYLNRPELTMDKFIDNPFDNGKKLYRTGDLARWLPDGNIEFLGRIDTQVKIRGFRIELGEIENEILISNDVKDAVVIAREDETGDKFLCAYIISDEKIDTTTIRNRIAENLPDYMIPSFFIQIESIPLTPNGKVDEKVLKNIELGYGKVPYMHKKQLDEIEDFRDKKRKAQINFEEKVMACDPDIVLDWKDPAPGKFSCFIIGISNVPIRCAEMIIRNGHRIFGMISNDSQVKEWAANHDIPFIQLQKEIVYSFLRLKPFDYLFSIVNPLILPPEILEIPKKHALNFHNGPLPRYGGTNATNWAVINKEKKHGITWHLLDKGVDTGDIVKQIALDLEPQETGISLNFKCLEAGIEAFKEVLNFIEEDRLPLQKQNYDHHSYYGNHSRMEFGCLVDFNQDAFTISSNIRGLDFGNYENPIGLPRLFVKNNCYILKEAKMLDNKSQLPPGTIVCIDNGSITISTKTNDVEIRKLKDINGNKISFPKFIEDYNLKIGDSLCLDETTKKRVEKLDKEICRHEKFWVKRLSILKPIVLTFTGKKTEEESFQENNICEKKFFLPVEINNLSGNILPRSELLLTAFTAYLACITRISIFDIGYTNNLLWKDVKGLEGIFANNIPLRIKIDFQSYSFNKFSRQIHKELVKLKKHRTFFRDIRLRYDVLKHISEESISVGVTVIKNLRNLDGIQSSFYKQLNLVIPEEGNACLVRYTPSLISGESVYNLFEQFLDFIHIVFLNPSRVLSGYLNENNRFEGDIQRWIKIEGNSIDMEHIENCIREHESIVDAAVVMNISKSGKKSLCAFMISKMSLKESMLKDYLKEKIPAYMMPAHFIQLDEMPMTGDNKINTKLLESVELYTGTGFEAPRNITEEKLAQIFHEVLGMDKNKISITESFFRLGGHSLKAAVLITKIHKEFNIKLSMSKFFERPSIKQLAPYIEDSFEEKYISIPLAPLKEYYPQTSAQKRLFFFDHLEKSSTLYNIPVMDIYHVGTDKDKLEMAFREMIKRHESLRTSFEVVQGEPVQKIADFNVAGSNFEIEYYETTQEGMIYSKQRGKEWTRITGMPFQDVVEHFVQPFDLTKPPLVRAGIINIAGAIQILMLDMHHIITDGVSMVIFLKELWALYNGKALPKLKIQYKDFSEWVNSIERKKEIKKQEKFWLKEFEGEIPLLNLPTDFPRPAKLTFDGDLLNLDINQSEIMKLKKMARKQGETLYMILLAAFKILLSKLSGQEEIIVGTVTAGRSHADLQPLIGMFVDTLAIRSFPTSQKTFKQYLREVKKKTLAALENQDYPFEELVSKVAARQDPSRNPLFDVSFGLENEADRDYLLEVLMFDKSNPYSYDIKKSKFELSFDGAETPDGLKFTIEYNTNLFNADTVEQYAKYYKNIITSISQETDKKIADIELASESEKIRILYEFNDFSSIQICDFESKTLHQLFEEQVERTPENIVIYGPRLAEPENINLNFTYRQLNNEANRLAKILRSKGILPDCTIGIITDPSIEMFTAMLGVMKSGAAYIPIDPTHPEDRIEFILNDSSTKVLLFSSRFPDDINFNGEKINLEDSDIIMGEECPNPNHISTPKNLVYIIYTSGTTGKPKGVMTEHRNVVAYLDAFYKEFNFNQTDIVLQQASYTFDVFVEEVFPIMMLGGKIAIPPTKNTIVDMSELANFVSENKINIIDCTPLLLNEINNEVRKNPNPWSSIHTFISGGDVLKPSYVDQLVKIANVYNTYGPTESTVCVTYYKYTRENAQEGMFSIPIGSPISGYQSYILDKNKKLQPIGIPGELCAAGRGISRGYLNRPELTHDTFIENPYMEGERIYRTGDLVRWLPDGNIDFSGRIDYQVKIRGYRIELGEIEIRLAEYPDIKEVVVMAIELPTGTGLCAYYTANKKISVHDLREYMDQHLPPYMIPSYFVFLEVFPKTSTGKVDRKALPYPSTDASAELYEAPRTSVEKKLVEAWQEILGVEQIGIEEDFFSLGGDSIKAIQIASKLQNKNLKLEVSQMFSQKNIKQLARFTRPLEISHVIDQGTVEGPVPLTPIQKWLFKDHMSYSYHFNQSAMLYKKEKFEQTIIEKVFTIIVTHHDALRMIFQKDSSIICQINQGIDKKLFELDVIYLEQNEQNTILTEINSIATRIQESINLESGPLVKLCLFKAVDGDYLLIIIHHLVVDGVSWRIIIEDFEAIYQNILDKKETILPKKTDSFKYWAQKQAEYAESEELLSQLPYWISIEETETQKIPTDNDVLKENKTFKYINIIPMELNVENTKALLSSVNKIYNTEINDILLTALGLSIKQWCGHSNILIDLEGHGREKIVKDIDINRTIGWFTTQFPVILDMNRSNDLNYSIQNVKETIRRIPQKGIGYGILKYLTPSSKKDGIVFKKSPEILFNYLGQFGKNKFELIDEIYGITELGGVGNNICLEFGLDHKIDIEGVISEKGTLNLNFIYNSLEYNRQTIQHLTDIYKSNLEMIINHCLSINNPRLTPSDVENDSISIDEFNQIIEILKSSLKTIDHDIKIKSMYPLTSMQESLLLKTIENKEAYFVQLIFAIPSSLDIQLLEESFNLLLEKHEVFRTIYFYNKTVKPLQIVMNEWNFPLDIIDISNASTIEKKQKIEEIKEEDKRKGFDLTSQFSTRAIMVVTGDTLNKLIWSSHNIAFDGWSMGIYIKDFITIYESLAANEQVVFNDYYHYKEYVKWIELHDYRKGLKFWKEYLNGYKRTPILLSLGKPIDKKEYKLKELQFTIDVKLYDGLAKVASSNRSTLNTLFQVLWGVLLQRLTGLNDIVFGAIVSGRSVDVEGIDRIVGLFTNIIPIRIKSERSTLFAHLLKEIQSLSAQWKQYENYPLPKILAEISQTEESIDNLLIFQNYPVEGERNVFSGNRKKIKLAIEDGSERLGHDFNIYIIPERPIEIRFSYNSLKYDDDLIQKIIANIKYFAEQIITSPEIKIIDLDTRNN